MLANGGYGLCFFGLSYRADGMENHCRDCAYIYETQCHLNPPLTHPGVGKSRDSRTRLNIQQELNGHQSILIDTKRCQI